MTNLELQLGAMIEHTTVLLDAIRSAGNLGVHRAMLARQLSVRGWDAEVADRYFGILARAGLVEIRGELLFVRDR